MSYCCHCCAAEKSARANGREDKNHRGQESILHPFWTSPAHPPSYHLQVSYEVYKGVYKGGCAIKMHKKQAYIMEKMGFPTLIPGGLGRGGKGAPQNSEPEHT
jgi:hypothetical protein